CEYTNTSAVGTYTITPRGLTSSNYEITFVNGTLTVTKANPEVSIGTKDPEEAIEITYGELITDEIANAQSNVEGTFSYEVYEINEDNDPILLNIDPTESAVDAGMYILKAVFMPEDTINYNEVGTEAKLVVDQAKTEINWETPEPITDDTALSEDQLNATANVEGIFKYDPTAGTYLEIGTHTLTVVFTPKSRNYTQATASVELTVEPSIEVELTWETPAPIKYGTPLSEIQLNAKANVEGDYYYNPTAGTVLNGGVHKLTVIFKPTNKHYKPQYQEVELVVEGEEPWISYEVDWKAGTMTLRFSCNLYESEDGKTWTLVEDAKDTYTVDIKQDKMKFYCAGK
ncbi:MAG: hypothetical protein IK033_06210, partial [Verrucomicrobia bacterium]|nr:hypothetical protein [Verrucomicrobiota bacterium]